MPISAGQAAPDFTLPDEKNHLKRLSDFRGRAVVLFFYPKDETPGCTVEACNFRDSYGAYVDADVIVLGVSPDAPKSHSQFKEKHNLPFPLLADTHHEAASLYGVWGLKKYMGREYEGVIRTTFLIDSNGRIARVFENVKPAEHSAQVLSAIEKL
ncbi:MAG: thioredoxin-dependent thiol peroxidase [Chloroflexi bacterium]|nr:thioredoxin-dependent thiol peroxidase [Chloroflexota bacterium]